MFDNTMFDTLKKIFGNSVVEIENPNPKIDYYGMGNQLRKHLHKHLDIKFEEWKSGVEIPLSVGDIVVLDKYNMCGSYNSWDSGPRSLIHKTHKPFKLEITEVGGTQSLASERVDRYFKQANYDRLFNTDGSIKIKLLERDFDRYCNDTPVPFTQLQMKKVRTVRREQMKNTMKVFVQHMKADNPYGFYLNCKYKAVDDTDVVIYQSGLNIRSFIPATSPLATKTLELWEMECSVNEIEEELNKMRKNFETKKQNVRNYITEVVDFYKN